MAVDVNNDKGSFTPYINSEEKYPRVTFPPGTYFARNTFRRGTIVLRIKEFGIHFNDNWFGIVVSEDLFPYIREVGLVRKYVIDG